MKKLIIVFIFMTGIALSQSNQSQAHDNDHDHTMCGTDQLYDQLKATNPEFVEQTFAHIEKLRQSRMKPGSNIEMQKPLGKRPTIDIPIRFYVLYSNASDNVDNLAFDKIAANFDQINLDFKNLNPDGEHVPQNPNPSTGTDANIDYAHYNARGTHDIRFVGYKGETTGAELIEGESIVRIQVSSSISGVCDAMNAVDKICPGETGYVYNEQYMSVYIATLGSGLLGQAYYTYPHAVVSNESVGSVENPGELSTYGRGRTLSHELGHNFTYPHPFNPSTCSSPIWSDVPVKTAPNYSAELVQDSNGNWYGSGGSNECIGTTNKGDQFMNYMDYVYDYNMVMFSNQQVIQGEAWALNHQQNVGWLEFNYVNTALSTTTSPLTTESVLSFNATFAEEVSGFSADDIVVTNGDVTNLNGGTGTSFDFEVTPQADGDVSVYVAAGAAVGTSSGFDNNETDEIIIKVDRVAPLAGNISSTDLDQQFYLPRTPNITINLEDFTDATSGVEAYFVSVGTIPGSSDIYSSTRYTSTSIDLNDLPLVDYQRYYVEVFCVDKVGLSSDVKSLDFYYFGSLLGDSNNDWIIDFKDYAAFISNYPGEDIAPTSGSMPYLFPAFDGESNSQDLAKMEEMWQWSFEQNGRSTPDYLTAQGNAPDFKILNDKLTITLPENAVSSQVYFEYSADDYTIDLNSLSFTDYSLINANDINQGTLHLELSNLNPGNSRDLMTLDFDNKSFLVEQLKVYFSSFDANNQLLSEGFEFLSTAPSNYRLAQSYPNPFNLPGTTIEFDLPTAQFLSIVIVDIRGRIVRKLIDNQESFGYQSIVWDGKNDNGDVVSSGVYFYQIRTSNFTEAGKLVFLR